MKRKNRNDELRIALIDKLNEFKNQVIAESSNDAQIIDCYLCPEDADALKGYINWTHTDSKSPYKVGKIVRISSEKVKFMVLLSPELKESKFILRDSNKIPLAPLAMQKNPIEELKRNHEDIVQQAYKAALNIPGGNNGKVK